MCIQSWVTGLGSGREEDEDLNVANYLKRFEEHDLEPFQMTRSSPGPRGYERQESALVTDQTSPHPSETSHSRPPPLSSSECLILDHALHFVKCESTESTQARNWLGPGATQML